MIKVMTFDPAKGKEVYCGYIDGDRFYRTVNNKHYMVKENGYGMQINVLEGLVRTGVKQVVLTTHTGTKLLSKVGSWNLKGVKRDYGSGEQIFLNTKYMEEIRR